MPEYLLAQVQQLMRTAREVYGVDPVIFLVLYLGCAPAWYYSLFRTLRGAARRRTNELILWSAVFMAATVLPFLYVMLFGRNIPWWVYALIAALVAQGAYTLVRRIRSRQQALAE